MKIMMSAIAINYLDKKLKVSHVNYGSEFTIDASNKVLRFDDS